MKHTLAVLTYTGFYNSTNTYPSELQSTEVNDARNMLR